jgi:hypothetical protein
MPADANPPSRSRSGSAIEPEGAEAETDDRKRLARDAERAAATPPPPSPPRPARKEKLSLRRCSHSSPSPRSAEKGEAAEDGASPPAAEALIESALPLPASRPSPRRSKVTARPEGRSALRQAPMRTRSAAENQNRRCSLLPSLPQPARGGSKHDERVTAAQILLEGMDRRTPDDGGRRRALEPARGANLSTPQAL